MKKIRPLLLGAVVLSPMVLTACESNEGFFERTGEATDEQIEDTKDAIDDMGQ